MSNPIRPNRLTDKAKERGVSPADLVIETVQRIGSINGAAIELDVARNTIRYWLKKTGHVTVTRRTVTLEKVEA